MWICFGIAVLARVLIASQELDLRYPTTNLSSEEIAEEGVVGGDELVSGKAIIESEIKDPYDNSIKNIIKELGSSVSKIFPNDPKNPQDQGDKRSKIKDQENQYSKSWISWVKPENKDLPFRNPLDPWQQIKKSQSFSPWGGKRETIYNQGPKVRRPIRVVPFNSWGGKKRSFSTKDYDKPSKFFTWGEKRTKFNAWGGKRSKNVERDDEEIKRNRFNAWGGKRNEKNDKRTSQDMTDAKKNVFNAWGGKRFVADNKASPQRRGEEEKRLKYNGNIFGVEKPGNKIQEAENTNDPINDEAENEEDEEEEEEIVKGEDDGKEFLSESEIINLAEKKMGSSDNYVRKSLFNSWGGRKRGENYFRDFETGLSLIVPGETHRHTRFWPWGG